MTPAQQQTAADEYRATGNIAAAAEAAGCAYKATWRYLIRVGLHKTTRKRSTVPYEGELGTKPDSEVAEAHGVTRQAVAAARGVRGIPVWRSEDND